MLGAVVAGEAVVLPPPKMVGLNDSVYVINFMITTVKDNQSFDTNKALLHVEGNSEKSRGRTHHMHTLNHNVKLKDMLILTSPSMAPNTSFEWLGQNGWRMRGAHIVRDT